MGMYRWDRVVSKALSLLLSMWCFHAALGRNFGSKETFCRVGIGYGGGRGVRVGMGREAEPHLLPYNP